MSDTNKPRNPWWELLLGGVLLLAGSVYVWWYLTDMERTPGEHRLPRTAAYLYEWGGKWAVVGLVAAVGALFSIIGVCKLVLKLRSRK